MNKTVIRSFLLSNFDKEEKWLNEQAGWILTKVKPLRYTFTKSNQFESIRMTYVEKNRKDYIEFMKDMGINYIGSISNWCYFSKADNPENPQFNLYSDNESKIKMLNRLINVMSAILIINIMAWIYNLLLGISQSNNMLFYGSFANLLLTIILLMGTIKLYRNRKILKERSRLQE